MPLFHTGAFQLHSGEVSGFKIDCDQLTDGEVYMLATLLRKALPKYGFVEGIPTGGVRLAACLESWAEPWDETLPILICDDVLTTGKSMEQARGDRENCVGCVLFARRKPAPWIVALFQMYEGVEGSSEETK